MAPPLNPLRIKLVSKEAATTKKRKRTCSSPSRPKKRCSQRLKFPLSPLLLDHQPTSNEEAQNNKPPHWRSQMKKHPKLFELYKAEEAIGQQLRRASWSDERRNAETIASNERMILSRKKKKEREAAAAELEKTQPAPSKDKNTINTRAVIAEQNEQRKKWREDKEKRRANMSQKQIDEANAKRRKKFADEKRELAKLRIKEIEEEKRQVEKDKQEWENKKRNEEVERLEEERIGELEMAKANSGIPKKRSVGARRLAFKRVKDNISKDDQIYTDTVVDLCTKTSPNQKKLLEEAGISMSSEDARMMKIVVETLGEKVKVGKSKRAKKVGIIRREFASSFGVLKKYRLQKNAVKKFGISAKLIRGVDKEYKYTNPRSISEETKVLVEKFYEDSAVQVADKKAISKKTLKPTAILQYSIQVIYTQFKEKHPKINLSMSSFFSLRPKHIKTMAAQKLRGCLCDYCENVSLKLHAINNLCVKHSLPHCKVKNSFVASSMTLCQKEGTFHKLACIKRQCTECGPHTITNHLMHLSAAVGKEDKVQWKKWKKVKVEKVGRSGKAMTINKTMIEIEEGTLKECIDELVHELHPYPGHLLNWTWQHAQYNDISDSPPEGHVIMVLDFAENYACIAQDEIQAGHWTHDQATVHPIVATFQCPTCAAPHVINHSLVFISDDRNHDYHAVHHFVQQSVDFLRQGSIPIRKIVRFSDGCAAQYKCRGAFHDIANSDVPTEHHYYGARHGKGKSDGESACVKRRASTAVKNGTDTIPDAEALFKYLKRNATIGNLHNGSCTSYRRTMLWVPVGQINRDRPSPDHPVKDTRKLHSVKYVNKGTIATRLLSCFCSACVCGIGECENRDYVDSWKETAVSIGSVSKPATKKQISKAAVQKRSTKKQTTNKTGRRRPNQRKATKARKATDPKHTARNQKDPDHADIQVADDVHAQTEGSDRPGDGERVQDQTEGDGQSNAECDGQRVKDQTEGGGQSNAECDGERVQDQTEGSGWNNAECDGQRVKDQTEGDGQSNAECDGQGVEKGQTTNEGQPKIGVHDFVAVRVQVNGKKRQRNEMFVAKVTALLEETKTYALCYMVKQGMYWSTLSPEEEVYEHPASDIICKLNTPNIVLLGSRIFNSFNLDKAEKIFAS